MSSAYIDLRGHQVFSYEWPNSGEALVLLHGGLSQTSHFEESVLPAVEGNFHIFGYDRTGHGFTGDQEGSMHYEFQCAEAIAYLEDIVQEPAHLIGHSDGSIISLMVAMRRPDLVKSVVFFGGLFHYSGQLQMPDFDGNISESDRAEYALTSPDAPETQEAKTRKMFSIWYSEPEFTVEDVAKISCPVLVLVGDDDVISHHHTIELFEALPQGQLAVIPGTSHQANKEKPEIFQMFIREFLADLSYPQTKMPQRRANNRPA
jgi:pimeloyl-ACP methyl ester carboxylesterase